MFPCSSINRPVTTTSKNVLRWKIVRNSHNIIILDARRILKSFIYYTWVAISTEITQKKNQECKSISCYVHSKYLNLRNSYSVSGSNHLILSEYFSEDISPKHRVKRSPLCNTIKLKRLLLFSFREIWGTETLILKAYFIWTAKTRSFCFLIFLTIFICRLQALFFPTIKQRIYYK